jgi:hypothetical protein
MGEDENEVRDASSPLCRYHQGALGDTDVTDHDIDYAISSHALRCPECLRLTGRILRARIDAKHDD